MQAILDQPVLLALVVFLARVTDVSLGTVRTVLLFRGRRVLAPIIGFFEVLIWISAAATVLQHLDHWYLAVAFAGGFAVGNYVGLWLEAKLAIGHQLVRTISFEPAIDLAARLREHGHEVVEVPGVASDERPVEVLLLVERRRRLPQLLSRIEATDPTAVTTISDVTPHLMHPMASVPGPRPRWFGVVKRR